MAVKSVLRTFLLVNVALMASAAVLPRAGTQFITGACTADADCASSCCGFKSGKCAAAVVAQERDGGCGFGDVAPNNIATIALGSSAAAAGVDNSKAGIRASGAAAAAPAAAASPAAAAAAPAAPATGSGKAPGTQFITGDCANDGECASTCCSVGKCAARLVATGPGGKGCGFGGGAAAAPAASPAAAAAPAASPAAASTGSGKAPGAQFITGPCANDGECASACCGFKSGKCAAPIVAQERDGGCGFGNATPNADALKKVQRRMLAAAAARLD